MSTRGFVVAVALCSAVSVTHAADQSVVRADNGSTYYPNAPGPNSYYPGSLYWTGFYLGINFGGGWGSAGWTDPFDGVADNPRPSVLMAGGQFGANWQVDAFVVGFEADVDGVSLDAAANDAAGFNHRVRTRWLSTVAARGGYAFGSTLVFVKGGAAFGDELDTVTSPAGLKANSSTTTQVGWTVGAGIEYSITHNWSARVGYDFIDLPSHNLVLVGPLGTAPGNLNLIVQRVTGGVNYRF
jgi:outer membrane immunogenic protein